MAAVPEQTTVPAADGSSILNCGLQKIATENPLLRAVEPPERDLAFAYQSLAIPATEDDAVIRSKYRPFLLPEGGVAEAIDWIKDVELATVIEMAKKDLEVTGERIKVLVLYGSLRGRYVVL